MSIIMYTSQVIVVVLSEHRLPISRGHCTCRSEQAMNPAPASYLVASCGDIVLTFVTEVFLNVAGIPNLVQLHIALGSELGLFRRL